MKVKEYLQRLQRLDTIINQKIKEAFFIFAPLETMYFFHLG